KKDPTRNFERYLLRDKIFKRENLEAIKKEIRRKVNEAHIFAKKSPYPKKGELRKYVFKE
ncbi:MAG TPA: thiamine pyrophosphate-dependent enzyme, partial [bacterium]|nr:thiamine pyrophosphate-dependent enzyme [bacterium]